jgi:HipA-like kinase
MCCELIASLLADELGLARPLPAIVDVDPNISNLLSPKDFDVAAMIKKSGGANFASRVLSGGYGTWPVNKSVPSSLVQLAAEIFAFDALIQNPDRRPNNPNLLWKGSEIIIIDHELAFSFLYQIGTSGRPWEVRASAGDFLNDHVFSKDLKGKKIDLTRFRDALEGIDKATLDALIDQVPIEWNNDNLSRMRAHFTDVQNHAEEFIEQVKWRLV